MDVVCFISIVKLQHLYIPVTLRTAEGSLNVVPDKLILRKCFPVGYVLFSLFAFILHQWVESVQTYIYTVPCVASEQAETDVHGPFVHCKRSLVINMLD